MFLVLGFSLGRSGGDGGLKGVSGRGGDGRGGGARGVGDGGGWGYE